jgi:hypothetical protein
MKAIQQFVFGISILLILYFIKTPSASYYYFNDTLGRALILFYIVVLTSLSPLFGLLFSVFLIVLYHSKVEPKVYPSNFEGMENKSDSKQKVVAPSVPTVKTSIPVSSVKKEEPVSNISSPEKSTPTSVESTSTSSITKTKDATAKDTTTKEGYENIHSPLTPSLFGRERDNIIRLEKMIRPKPSKSYMVMPKTKWDKDDEPLPYYYGKQNSLQIYFLS